MTATFPTGRRPDCGSRTSCWRAFVRRKQLNMSIVDWPSLQIGIVLVLVVIVFFGFIRELMAPDIVAFCGIDPLHLAGDEAVADVVHAGAAVGLRDGGAQEAEAAHLGHDRAVEGLVAVGL